MPTEQYGNSQIKEVRFSQSEIVRIVLENLQERAGTPYDFDYDRPIVLWNKGELILRFVQGEITREAEPRHLEMRPMPKGKK
jgi:hypothetical protein